MAKQEIFPPNNDLIAGGRHIGHSQPRGPEDDRLGIKPQMAPPPGRSTPGWPPAIVAPGRGAVPVEPYQDNGMPARAATLPDDAPMRR